MDQVWESNEINNSSFNLNYTNTYKSFHRKDYSNDNISEAYNGRYTYKINQIQRLIMEIKDGKSRTLGDINLKSTSPANNDIFFHKSIEFESKIINLFLGKKPLKSIWVIFSPYIL